MTTNVEIVSVELPDGAVLGPGIVQALVAPPRALQVRPDVHLVVADGVLLLVVREAGDRWRSYRLTLAHIVADVVWHRHTPALVRQGRGRPRCVCLVCGVRLRHLDAA